MDTQDAPKKRGRRKKIVPETDVKTTKKGKKYADLKDIETNNFVMKNQNIIMHLKCSIAEIDKYISEQRWKTDNLTYDPKVPHDFVPYDIKQMDLHLITDEPNTNKTNFTGFVCEKCDKQLSKSFVKEKDEFSTEDSQKLKELKLTFYRNEIPNKKVDCFWCTCPYDYDPFYILQYGSTGDYLAHGSFCSPECGVAFLLKNMNWDDSAKMESYQLMNSFYTNNGNIKPACSPFYFLEKYYGNMTIQEYRKLSKTSHVMLTLDKPVTRMLPEVHEDNEKLHLNGANRGNYKVKKQSEKSNLINRNDILRETFCGGLTCI